MIKICNLTLLSWLRAVELMWTEREGLTLTLSLPISLHKYLSCNHLCVWAYAHMSILCCEATSYWTIIGPMTVSFLKLSNRKKFVSKICLLTNPSSSPYKLFREEQGSLSFELVTNPYRKMLNYDNSSKDLPYSTENLKKNWDWRYSTTGDCFSSFQTRFNQQQYLWSSKPHHE